MQQNLAVARASSLTGGCWADALYVKALLARRRGQWERRERKAIGGWRWRPAICRFSMSAPFSRTKRATTSPVGNTLAT